VNAQHELKGRKTMDGKHRRPRGARIAAAIGAAIALAACAGTQKAAKAPEPAAGTAKAPEAAPAAQAKYVFTILFDANDCMTGTTSSGPPGSACDPADGPPAQCLLVPRGERVKFKADPPSARHEFVVKFQRESPFGQGQDPNVPSSGGSFEKATRTDVQPRTHFPFTVSPASSPCPQGIDPQIILN
jgi:hypothetical protein